jgi:hypothetical protein
MNHQKDAGKEKDGEGGKPGERRGRKRKER